jgi:DNA replication protein DnaD
MGELNNQVLYRHKNLDTKRKLISHASLKNKSITDIVEEAMEDYVKNLGESENRNLLSFFYDMEPNETKRYRKFKVNKAGVNLTTFFEMVKEIIDLSDKHCLNMHEEELQIELNEKIYLLKPVLNRLTNIYSQKKLEL